MKKKVVTAFMMAALGSSLVFSQAVMAADTTAKTETSEDADKDATESEDKDVAEDADKADEEKEDLKTIGEKPEEDTEGVFSVKLKNLTGKVITGVTVKNEKDEEYPDNFLKEEDKFEADEERVLAQILRRLKFDNDTIRKVTRLVKWHDDRPDGTTKAVRRAVNRIGEDLFPYYLEVQQADMLAQSDYRRTEKQERLDKVKEAYETIINEHQCVSLKTLAVTGKDLIEAGYKPGREIGETLNRLLEVVLADPQKNQKEILLGLLDEK